VHLGLDDVDRALARVADGVLFGLGEVVHGYCCGDHGIQNTLGDFARDALLVGVQNGGVRHQVADVAHKHQRAAVQAHRLLAIRCGVDAVGIEAAGKGLVALGDFFGQRALQNTKPVAVGQHLVVGVHGGYRVFKVKDSGQGRFQYQVGHAGRVFGTDGRGAVDDQVQVQAVVFKQHA